jgi:hypothetical protein
MAWTRRAMWGRVRAEVVFAIGMVAFLGVFGVAFVAMPQLAVLAQRMLA